jgi:hypothetical protein
MKTTIYDLLGMIKNNNAPKQIEFSGMKWELKEDDYYWSDGIYLDEYCDLTKSLNDEVEILDEPKEDKIEKLNDILRIDDIEPPYDSNLKKIWVQTIKNHNKVNELIDEVNKLKEE